MKSNTTVNNSNINLKNFQNICNALVSNYNIDFFKKKVKKVNAMPRLVIVVLNFLIKKKLKKSMS